MDPSSERATTSSERLQNKPIQKQEIQQRYEGDHTFKFGLASLVMKRKHADGRTPDTTDDGYEVYCCLADPSRMADGSGLINKHLSEAHQVDDSQIREWLPEQNQNH